MSASSTPSAEDSAGIAGFTAAIRPAGHVRRCGRALPCHDLDGERADPDSEGTLGMAAGVVAYRRHTASGSAALSGAGTRQIIAAGLLTNLVSSLLVTVSGTGTIAAMLKAAWLRNWLYHDHPLAGVGGLRLLVHGDPGALAFSHQITAAVDAPPFLIICVVFPLLALGLTGFGALVVRGNAAAGNTDPPRGNANGGPPGPDAVPDPPEGAQLAGSNR